MHRRQYLDFGREFFGHLYFALNYECSIKDCMSSGI
jgi:hypothetical protein